MTCSTVWNQSCLSSPVLTPPPAHKMSQSSGEPWDSISVEFHISSISYPLLPSPSPSGQLGRKRHLVNAASLLLLRELEQGEAAPRPDLPAAFSLWFPLLVPACCQNTFLLQLNKQNSEMPLRTGLYHISNWMLANSTPALQRWLGRLCVPQFHYLIIVCQREKLKGHL